MSSYLALALLCLLVALLALWIFSRPASALPNDATRPVSFVFDGEEIVGTSHLGDLVLRNIGRDKVHDWHLLRHGFQSRFPDLPGTAAEALGRAPSKLAARDPDDRARLILDRVRGGLQVRLEEPDGATAADRHLRMCHFDRLDHVGLVANLFPYPVWLQSASGRPEWANRAYQRLLISLGPSDVRQEDIPAFSFDLAADATTRTERVRLEDTGKDTAQWYSVTRTRTRSGSLLGYAIDIDQVIAAENAQRNFVQTLTKTFAQLSTGLAIFDRNRQLALFNPALVDLLAVPVDFLSARPTLLTFFDTLRDNRMMPEPKDYATWRQRITDLVIASADGRYQETWTLPSGLTYRVTGRPHPDGAIALLFEDISAEISLTRRFRSQLNLGQAVIDSFDEAIAVFSQSGSLTLTNLAFRQMWALDPDGSLHEIAIPDAIRHWQGRAAPGPVWEALGTHLSGRTPATLDITQATGGHLQCRVVPLPGGATLVGFRPQADRSPTDPPTEQGHN